MLTAHTIERNAVEVNVKEFKPKLDLEDGIPLAAAAKLYGVHRLALTRAVERDRIRGQQVHGHWFVERADIEDFAAEYKTAAYVRQATRDAQAAQPRTPQTRKPAKTTKPKLRKK